MRFIHWAYCFAITLGHFLYTLSFPSLINGERYIGSSSKLLEPSYLHAFFLSRIQFGEFARRPLTTWLIQSIEKLGLSLEWSFLFVEYLGIFMSILLLFQLTIKLLESERYAYLSTFIYITSFWVLHGLFAEIYAYDEPWQYVAIFSSFLYLRIKRWLLFSLFFLIAMIARESTLLLLPGIYFFFVIDRPLFSKVNLIRTIQVGWIVPAYGVFLYTLIQALNLATKSSSYMEDVRFKHLYYSFADTDIGIDTLTSFGLSVAVAATLLYARKTLPVIKNDMPWIWAFVLNFGVNAFITFTLTMGRETRIFAQPVLLILPFLGYYLYEGLKRLERPFGLAFHDLESFLKWISILFFFSAFVFGISLFSYELYWPTDTKFFSGFQHWAYLTFSFCLLFVILIQFRRADNKNRKKSVIPALLLLLPIALFFGSQSGYRAFDTFSPVKEYAQNLEVQTSRIQHLVVSSTMPNLAENYFRASGLECLAGDFNFQLPIKQFLYRKDQYMNGDILYLELEPAINFPFRYILSGLGNVETESIGEKRALRIETNKPIKIEPNTFYCEIPENGFRPKTSFREHNSKGFEFSEEYSVAFKGSMRELKIDSLKSFAVKSDFICDMSAEAALVVTIKSPDVEDVWEHEFLSIYLTDENGWNTAYMAIGSLDFKDPETEIAFYVWNPKKDIVKLRNLEIVINTGWVSIKVNSLSVLDSRKLK